MVEFLDIACAIKVCDPYTYVDAHCRPKWENTMAREYCSLMKNKTQDLVPQIQGKTVMKC